MNLGAEALLVGQALLAAALIIALRPAWIVPIYVALVWMSLPGGIYGGLPSPVEVGGIVLLGAALWRAPRQLEAAGAAFGILAILSVAAIASALAATESTALPLDWLRELSFLVIAALLLIGERSVHRTAVALCWAGAFLGLGAVYSVVVGPTELFPLNEGVEGLDPERAAGPFGEANFFALSLAALGPFAVYLSVRGGAGRLLGLLTLVAILAGVVATGSRGGMIALVVGVSATWLALTPRRGRAVLTLLALAVASTPLLVGQFQSLEERPISGRATENMVAIEMFGDHPLTGVGNANFETLYRDYAREVGNDPRPVRAAHSLPLEIAAEQGLAGILAWLTAAAILLRFAVARGVWAIPLGRAALLALTTYMVGSLFLQGSQLRWLFLLAGLVVALGADRASVPKRARAATRAVPEPA